MGVFVFLLGAVSSLLVAFLLLVNFLNKAEEKIQKSYDEAKQALEPEVQKVVLSTKKTQVQVSAVGSADVPEWLYGLVNNNMVFFFKEDLDASASGVFCLDGCKVTVIKNNTEQSSPWHKKNPIQVSCERTNTLLILCKSAREAEMWYYSLLRGANLSVKKDATADQKAKKEQTYFRFLHTILKTAEVPHTTSPSSSPAVSPTVSHSPSPAPPPSPSPAPVQNAVPPLTRTSSGNSLLAPHASTTHHELNSNLHSHLTWLNALLSRVFWNIHDAPELSAYLTSKLNKKLLKVKKPAVLKTVAVCNVSFGPNFPMLTSARLDHVDSTGEVVASGDLVYHGGFTLTVSFGISIEVMGHSLAVPVMVTARVTRLHGRAVVCIPAPPSCRIWFAFEREPTCDLEVDTTFGAAGKVANIPRVAKIIVNALKTELIKIIVLPNMEDFQLPKFKGQVGDKSVIDHVNDGSSSTISSIPNLTKNNSPSNSTTNIDHKLIDEAFEKLAKSHQELH